MRKINLLKYIFVFLFVVNATILGCGSIEIFVKAYFDSSDVNHERATYFLHCETVYFDTYKDTKQQHQLLGEMILDCLDNSSVLNKLFAIKSYFLFDELNKLGQSNLRTDIIKRIKEILRTNTLEYDKTNRKLSFYNFVSSEDYAVRVDREIREMFNIGRTIQGLIYNMD